MLEEERGVLSRWMSEILSGMSGLSGDGVGLIHSWLAPWAKKATPSGGSGLGRCREFCRECRGVVGELKIAW